MRGGGDWRGREEERGGGAGKRTVSVMQIVRKTVFPRHAEPQTDLALRRSPESKDSGLGVPG